MSELAREREALSRACVKTMRAKGLTFKRLADEPTARDFMRIVEQRRAAMPA